ncbi:MAG: insulinase family protein [Candidatus Yanofskybacteria bacterium]|nr:insulinase family protein [Candidatus Yanofskybacteria bacterium]
MSKGDSANHHGSHTYSNGLRLITVPMEHTKSVTVLVLVATGSRYETKEINGISHFLEHMMFKGTTKRPGTLDISHELDSIGADYNAFTSKEYTGYYVKCAADKIDTAVDVISDIFQNSKLDAKEIDKERGPVKEEINMYFDHPPRRVAEIYDELIYGDQPLGWNIAGKKETIDQLSREDFIKYFSSHYFAKNTVVIVAGNIDAEATKDKIHKFFNNVREYERTEPVATVEHQTAPALKIEYKKTDQSHISLGFRAYSRFHPKYEALSLLAAILGGGMSSRLFIEVRERRGLAYRIGTGISAYNEIGDITTSAGLNNDKLMDGLGVILEEHKKMILEKVTEKELGRVKDQIRGSFVIGLETSDSLASFYGEQELLEHKIETPEERLAKITAVTADDIMGVARDIFRPEWLNLALIGPFEEREERILKILNDWHP